MDSAFTCIDAMSVDFLSMVMRLAQAARRANNGHALSSHKTAAARRSHNIVRLMRRANLNSPVTEQCYSRCELQKSFTLSRSNFPDPSVDRDHRRQGTSFRCLRLLL